MSSSPFPYTCELCGAEGLNDEGMRAHTLEAHIAGRPECPFCDCAVPQPQLLGHVQQAHLHYLTPERELMAFIDDQTPSYDDDSKMTTADSCSFYTPGSMNGWHSPDAIGSSSIHNGAISKNFSSCQNGFRDCYKDREGSKEEERSSRSLRNINLVNGPKNLNNINGVIPKTSKKLKSRENSAESDNTGRIGATSSPSHEGSPNKKMAMASAGQGSPLRSQLALKLKPNTPKKSMPSPSPTVQCLLCDFRCRCPQKLEEHINRAHFDLTSPSVMENANTNSNPTLEYTNSTLAYTNAVTPGRHVSSYQCPICEMNFQNGSDVEMHVNIEHSDILSPQKGQEILDNAGCDEVMMMEESPVSNCPVCCQPLPILQHELLQHIEEHFERGETGEDGNLARGLTEEEREAQRTREQQEFQMLRAQYGMEDESPGGPEGYAGRAASGLRRAVYSGALSVAGYYERSVGLKRATAAGRDDGSSCTPGLLERIAQLNTQSPSIICTYLCSAVNHYASTYGDRGWGCGYRNMQMVLSSLLRHGEYAERIAAVWDCDVETSETVPSIPRLQLMVERAWQMGFDTQGSEQLGSKLYNTRKWIGACEVVTVLSSLRIRCQLIDFHKPTGADGGHPALFDWVHQYFQEDPNSYKPPIYLQHQGHSRTIIGYEKHRDGKATLLVLDPSHAPAQVRQVLCGNTSASTTALRLLRRGSSALHAKQYQLVCVNGVIRTDEEYEMSKVLQSVRIP